MLKIFIAKNYSTQNIIDFAFEKSVKLSYDSYGKPSVDNGKEIGVTDSNGFKVLAVYDKPIGIDIELMKERDYLKIAKRHFSEKEIEMIEKGNKNTFYRLWTAKEAYTKYLGKGFTFESIDNIEKQFNIKYTTIDDKYLICVISKSKVEKVTVTYVN